MMSFDEFAAKVVEMAGDIPCTATFTKGFNGAPTTYVATIEAYPEHTQRAQSTTKTPWRSSRSSRESWR